MARLRIQLVLGVILSAALAGPAAAVDYGAARAEAGAELDARAPAGVCYGRSQRSKRARRATRKARRAGRSKPEREGSRPRRRLPRRHSAPPAPASRERGRQKAPDRERGASAPAPADAGPGDRDAAEANDDGRESAPDDPGAPEQTKGKGHLRQSNRMEFDARIVKGETAGTGAVVLFERSQRPLPTLSSRRTKFLRPTIEAVFGESTPAARRDKPRPKATSDKQQRP